MLALNRKISWWLATLVLSRDIILLTAAAVILVVVGYRPFPPSIYGKATTALQILLVFAVVLAGGDGLGVAGSVPEHHRLSGRRLHRLLRLSLLLHGRPPPGRAADSRTGFRPVRFCDLSPAQRTNQVREPHRLKPCYKILRALQIIHDHETEADRDRNPRSPSKKIRAPPLAHVRGSPVRHQSAEQVARHHARRSARKLSVPLNRNPSTAI